MSGFETILYDATRAGVGILRLNRPEVHNAFNDKLVEELNDLLDELKGADGTRVLFIEGAGKSFSAGADLETMRTAGHLTHKDNVANARDFAHMLKRLRDLPMPTVALVNGAAMGGGVGIVAACDIAVAVRSAFFSLSEVRLGLIPAMISPYVIEAIGPRAARRYFTTAERFDAEEAKRIGLVHIVVEDMEAMAQESERLAGEFFKNAPDAMHDAKRLVEGVMWRELDHHLVEDTAKRIADRRASDEGKEGTTAFLEKRQPFWAK